MLAEYAHNKVPKGNYVMLWGDAADNNARLMSEGQNKYLQEFENRGDVNVIYRTYVDGWLERNARFQLQKVIDYVNGKTNNRRIDVPTLYMPPQIIDKDNLISILVEKDHTYSLEELQK